MVAADAAADVDAVVAVPSELVVEAMGGSLPSTLPAAAVTSELVVEAMGGSLPSTLLGGGGYGGGGYGGGGHGGHGAIYDTVEAAFKGGIPYNIQQLSLLHSLRRGFPLDGPWEPLNHSSAPRQVTCLACEIKKAVKQGWGFRAKIKDFPQRAGGGIVYCITIEYKCPQCPVSGGARGQ